MAARLPLYNLTGATIINSEPERGREHGSEHWKWIFVLLSIFFYFWHHGNTQQFTKKKNWGIEKWKSTETNENSAHRNEWNPRWNGKFWKFISRLENKEQRRSNYLKSLNEIFLLKNLKKKLPLIMSQKKKTRTQGVKMKENRQHSAARVVTHRRWVSNVLLNFPLEGNTKTANNNDAATEYHFSYT